MPPDSALLKRLDRLSSALICDILDDYHDGVSNDRFLMDRRVKPVFPARVSGVAKTLSGASSAGGGEPAPNTDPNPIGNAALESIRQGEVIVYATDSCAKAACWGELMTTAALARGGRGLVTDGLARDVTSIMGMKATFPVFAAGTIPTSGKGRFAMRAFDVPVWCGGVQVKPGDLVLGDMDGVVVLPREIAGDVISKCEERSKTEGKVRSAYGKGAPVADIMRKYKVG